MSLPAERAARRAVALPLAALALPAWAALALGSGGVAVPALCSSALLWSVPSVDGLAFFLATVPPGALAFGWALMVAAMMLPTLAPTLGYLRARSFAHLRPTALTAALLGYALVWLAAGLPLLGLAVLVRIGTADPVLPVLFAGLLALVWQASPWKQAALNRCHRQPRLAAFAPAALRDAARLGAAAGLWCLLSCWPLMLLGLMVPALHLPVMALLALVIWAEQMEAPRPPAWTWRLPRRAARRLARAL